ncbi:MAG: PocR ligand-binding domain-containing protein [Treponema sp.]|nr:PocR ligand-binding domain-containing protein [Treponema sp.]
MIVYDKKHLDEIMDAFHTLSGIHVGLHYTNGMAFLSNLSGMSLFCSLIRTNPEIDKKCMDCDLQHMEECKKLNIPVVYNCHMGLTEVIVPLKENNVIICYCMFGQILIEEFKEHSRLLIYNNAKETGFDETILQNAIDKIQCVDSAKLKALVKILEIIMSQALLTKLINYPKINFLTNLNLFIDSHISENILIKDICENFHMSRSFLYTYSKKYIDCSVNEYILNRKINYMKNLLENSKLKIKELPPKIGFSDYNYFARVFRKKTGISPRAFRQGKDINPARDVKNNQYVSPVQGIYE